MLNVVLFFVCVLLCFVVVVELLFSFVVVCCFSKLENRNLEINSKIHKLEIRTEKLEEITKLKLEFIN